VILRAPLIYPVDSPPIQDGAVLVRDERIVAVGPAPDIEKQAPAGLPQLDLPNSILLPGFVNAHSHLELTSLEGLAYPGEFTDWIRKVVEAKPKIAQEDYEKGIDEGVRRMIASGITTVGDHVSFNTDLEHILKSPLRGILFVEVLGVVREVAEDILGAAEEFERLYGDSPRFRVIASPHSVHAVHRDILPKLFQSPRPVLSIHLAESEDEDRYFREKKGPLFDLIAQRNAGEIRESPLQSSAIRQLENLGLLSSQIMLVHGNYLDESDVDLVARHNISVVHCPSSRAYFFHRQFPLTRLREGKVNIALGTDSLGSGDSLSMLDQIRIARAHHPEVSAEDWIHFATLGGATALKMEKEIGSITPGKKADLIAFQMKGKGQDPSEIVEQALQATRAHFVMIDGKAVT